MSEQDRSLASMQDDEVEHHRHVQALLQAAVDEVAASAKGRDTATIATELTRALRDRGIQEQPPRWVDAVAEDLAMGLPYVADPSQRAEQSGPSAPE